MGSKGTQSTTQNTNQSYQANPVIQGAANQAIAGAQSAASQPFQMPVAPVAGFNPTQQQAFQQYGQLQGMAQPYFNQASTYANQSAAPITGADVSQYYNPMADNVTKQLQNIYGEQNVQNQGSLTAKAGGVGADRIAVGMADLANQQGLASGQIYSQLYQQALQAAQQQKQMAAGAGNAMASYGAGAQSAQLQGTGALNQAGNQQQQQTQAQLNAPYQNTLAQIAYQFQTPQYLAGITGGLAPALGGTTNGQQVTTAPQPSLMSQILGLGTAGAGIYGALNSNGQVSPSELGTAQNPLNGLSPQDYQGYGPGGNQINPFGFARGGGTPTDKVFAYHMARYKAAGGEVEDQGPAIPGISIPKTDGASEPIPLISLHPGAGHSGPLTGGIQFSQPQQQQGSGETVGGDIAKAASAVLPFFLKRGGPAGYDDGGGTDGWNSEVPDLSKLFNKPEPAATFNDRFGAAFPNANPAPKTNPIPSEANPSPIPAGKVPLPKPYPGPDKPGSHPDAVRLDKGTKASDDDETPSKTPFIPPPANRETSPAAVGRAMIPLNWQPYPDATHRDMGQEAVRSPWLSLIKAGATMAATPGPLGVSMGKGLLAGATGLETQRTALRSEQELNDKAQELYEKSLEHLDKYTKMTPYERASVTARNREIDQSEASGVPGADSIANRALHSRALSYFKLLKADVNYMNKPDSELLAKAYEMAGGVKGTGAAPTVGGGSDATTALPDPGDGKRQTGKWYIGPSGKPQQWQG